MNERITISKEHPPMYYYLLLHPQNRIDDQARTRRPQQDHQEQRVYQLPSDRRGGRNAGRR